MWILYKYDFCVITKQGILKGTFTSLLFNKGIFLTGKNFENSGLVEKQQLTK